MSLFADFQYQLSLPTPFDTGGVEKSSLDIKSVYRSTQSRITLHPPTLKAVVALAETEGGIDNGIAIGKQGDHYLVEWTNQNIGQTTVVAYNQKNGTIKTGVFTSPESPPTAYKITKKGGYDGAEIILAILASQRYSDSSDGTNQEWEDARAGIEKCLSETDRDAEWAVRMSQQGIVLCDNIDTRIKDEKNLGADGIKVVIPSGGNVPNFSPLSIAQGTYTPTEVFQGEFAFLKKSGTKSSVAKKVSNADLPGMFALSDRKYSATEKLLIPAIPEWYLVPKEVVNTSKHAQATSASNQPMRNFMMRGPAGVGKTEGAMAIAAALNLPYLSFTCSANTEIFDLLGQILPDIEGVDGSESSTLSQKFRYVETPLVRAMKYGYLIEIQEPSVIANPGVLVGLNSLLDRCKQITLPTGETLQRHPDTVVIVTTNNDYAGCRNINQSVISRMNLVFDVEEPSEKELIKRVTAITGCDDEESLKIMADVVKTAQERCREYSITDGSCGMRELIAWVQSFMITGSMLDSAEYTILSSLSSDPENRKEIKDTCITPKIVA